MRVDVYTQREIDTINVRHDARLAKLENLIVSQRIIRLKTLMQLLCNTDFPHYDNCRLFRHGVIYFELELARGSETSHLPFYDTLSLSILICRTHHSAISVCLP